MLNIVIKWAKGNIPTYIPMFISMNVIKMLPAIAEIVKRAVVPDALTLYLWAVRCCSSFSGWSIIWNIYFVFK